MSNRDPRDLFISANPTGLSSAELEKDTCGFVDDRTHGDYLVFKAGYQAALEVQQGQGEPVGYVRASNLRNLRLAAHCAAIEMTGVPRRDGDIPLYTHADPAEVERLHQNLKACTGINSALMVRCKANEADLDSLSAQLAERDALCKRLAYHLGPALAANQGSMSEECIHDALAAIHEWTQIALSSTAEPSAPVEIDERERFQAYCAKVGLPLDVLPSGEYLIPATRFVSQGWHAHAASRRKP